MSEDPYADETPPRYGDNGSVMRLAPIPLAYAHDPEQTIRLAGEMSRTTHGAPEPVDACRYSSRSDHRRPRGETKQTLLEPLYSPIEGLWDTQPLSPEIDEIAQGSFKIKHPPRSAAPATWSRPWRPPCGPSTAANPSKRVALKAVNLGDDADTTGAIYGQLAAAWLGGESRIDSPAGSGDHARAPSARDLRCIFAACQHPG
jgi:hypothetical protein